MNAPAKPSLSHRLELARIAGSPGVVPNSLVTNIGDDVEEVCFEIETEQTVGDPAADIRPTEPIKLVYRDGRAIGQTAPSFVSCERTDFPDQLVHLCPVGKTGLTVPCLALAGLQPLYERMGIEAVMERLRGFLRDAKTGTLIKDGWEPVPFAVDQSLCSGEVIPHYFQDLAHQNLKDGYAYGASINLEENGSKFVVLFPQHFSVDEMPEALAFRNTEGKRRGVPWVFVWPTQVQPKPEPVFDDWQSGAELYAGLEQLGIKHQFDAAVGQLLEKGVDFKTHREPAGGKAMVVVVGVWRPEPIMRQFFGYSTNPDARKLELRAFHVSHDVLGAIVANDTTVETIVGDYPSSPELHQWVSGLEPIPPAAVIGCGALGSTILNQLVRSGLSDAIVIDYDHLRPHNLTRHTGLVGDLYRPKVESIQRHFTDLIREMSLHVESIHADLQSMSDDEFRQRVGNRLIIDTSADERVRVRMDEIHATGKNTIVRSEMFDEGRLGVTIIAPPGGSSITDMMHHLYALAANEPAIAGWLARDAANPLGPDPLLSGFGCTSQTFHLPLHAIEQHASVATASLAGDIKNSQIILNPLDASLRPTGWKRFEVEPFDTMTPDSAKDWTIRLSAEARSEITAAREDALPAETGGYLYGAWDPKAKMITITNASGLPPDSIADENSLKLGPAMKTSMERKLVRKAQGRIYLCGTWHSHPNESANLSGTDYKTMMSHHKEDAAMLRPTLLVIAAANEMKAHLALP